MLNKVHLGNCLDVLKKIPDNFVDSIVTDPPYELGFMGKSWDNTGIANNVDMWKECLRVLKPGGHLLSFGGTRTYHRMASAIEDAGFEVRDMIEWVYGSGFPKSLNIGKAVDKLQGNEREEISHGGKCGVFAHSGSGVEQNIDDYEAIITKGTSEWEGWGTALKPAHEPICMARKPLSEKTVAENCLKWGTGGINIDESRVETNGEEVDIHHTKGASMFKPGEYEEQDRFKQSIGRFPANLIHDNSEEVRECFPETGSPRKARTAVKGGCGGALGNFGGSSPDAVGTWPDDNGGNASRFFKSIIYQAKASKGERNKGCEELEEKLKPYGNREEWQVPENGDPKGSVNDKFTTKPTKNNHPTVKPITLMSYLIKMITPKGGLVLDPFAGSGSTLVAAKQSGCQFIGIEMEEEYIKIAEARINNF